MDEGDPGRAGGKKERTRLNIQRTAWRLFIRDGYDATTVHKIAQEAGVTHTTFFRHFASKERVLIEEQYSLDLVRSFAAQPRDIGLVRALRNATIEVYGALDDEELERHRQRDLFVMATPELRNAWYARVREMFESIREIAAERANRDPDDLVIRTFRWTMSGVLIAGSTHWHAHPELSFVACIEEAFDCFDRQEFGTSTSADLGAPRRSRERG